MNLKKRVWIHSALGVAAMLAVSGAAWAQETMKIGLLATLEGPFAVPGQDSMRGADLALKDEGFGELLPGSIAGRPWPGRAQARRASSPRA